MNRRHHVGFCLAGYILSLGAVARAEPESPPTQVFSVDLGAADRRDLVQSRRTVTRQSDTMAAFSFIGRRPLGSGPFYIAGGLRGERFGLDSSPDFPIRELQDYGAQFSIEYFIGAVRAAYLTVSPGFYFEDHPTMAAWDAPVEFATGIPLTAQLNGVAGVSWGRFWHHPVPIAGLLWTLNRRWRIEALYPNPAVVWTVNDALEARLAGELLGSGFRTDADPGRSVVQYYVYRAGINLGWKMRPGFKVTSGAGWEYERVIDYWRAGQSYRATGAPYVRLGLEFSR